MFLCLPREIHHDFDVGSVLKDFVKIHHEYSSRCYIKVLGKLFSKTQIEML